MPGAFDDCFNSNSIDSSSSSSSSSDYGSDFSPEEETLLGELLTQAVVEHATAPAILPRQPFPNHQRPQFHPSTEPVAVTDIEQCHEIVPERLPRVLGRAMPPWQVARFRRSPDQGPGYGGAAIGNFLLSFYLFDF